MASPVARPIGKIVQAEERVRFATWLDREYADDRPSGLIVANRWIKAVTAEELQAFLLGEKLALGALASLDRFLTLCIA